MISVKEDFDQHSNIIPIIFYVWKWTSRFYQNAQLFCSSLRL